MSKMNPNICISESCSLQTGNQRLILRDIQRNNAQHFDPKRQYMVSKTEESQSIFDRKGIF